MPRYHLVLATKWLVTVTIQVSNWNHYLLQIHTYLNWLYTTIHLLGPSGSSDGTLDAGPSSNRNHHYNDSKCHYCLVALLKNSFKSLCKFCNYNYTHTHTCARAHTYVYVYLFIHNIFVETKEDVYIDSDDEDIQSDERSVEHYEDFTQVTCASLNIFIHDICFPLFFLIAISSSLTITLRFLQIIKSSRGNGWSNCQCSFITRTRNVRWCLSNGTPRQTKIYGT